MLPDFTAVKRKIARDLDSSLERQIHGDPLTGKVNRVIQYEGHDWTMKTFDGDTDKAGFDEIAVEMTVKREDIIREGPEAYRRQIARIAEEIIGQQHGMLFRKMDAITAKTGNVVSGAGRPFTFDLVLEGYERMAIDFDEYGRPLMPTLVMHPELWEKVKAKIPEWEANPDYRRRLDEMIEKKRREWLDRESNRKLVD